LESNFLSSQAQIELDNVFKQQEVARAVCSVVGDNTRQFPRKKLMMGNQ